MTFILDYGKVNYNIRFIYKKNTNYLRTNVDGATFSINVPISKKFQINCFLAPPKFKSWFRPWRTPIYLFNNFACTINVQLLGYLLFDMFFLFLLFFLYIFYAFSLLTYLCNVKLIEKYRKDMFSALFIVWD